MPTAETTKTRRESWIDWVPPEGREDALLDAEPLLTRAELVAELRRGGDDVSARDLVYWQSVGAIPYPVKRQHQGAPHAFYPKWFVGTVHQLKSLQQQGYKLREIGPLLRGDMYHRFMPRALTPQQEQQRAKRVAKRALSPLMEELNPRIRSLARIHERLHGGQIPHAEVRLIDDQGKDHTYLFLTGDQPEADPLEDVKTIM